MSNTEYVDIPSPAALEEAGEPAAPEKEVVAEDIVTAEPIPEPEVEEPEDEEPSKPSKKSGIQRQKEKIRALEARLAAMEGAKTQVAPAASSNGAPRPEAFDDIAEYMNAVVEHKLAAKTAKDLQEKQAALFNDRYKAAITAHPDLPDLLEDLQDVGSVDLNELVFDSDNSTDLFYYLASNPEEARRINALPPKAMAREIGRIEARLETPKPKKPVAVSKAAPPIIPVQPVSAPVARKRQEDAYVDM